MQFLDTILLPLLLDCVAYMEGKERWGSVCRKVQGDMEGILSDSAVENISAHLLTSFEASSRNADFSVLVSELLLLTLFSEYIDLARKSTWQSNRCRVLWRLVWKLEMHVLLHICAYHEMLIFHPKIFISRILIHWLVLQHILFSPLRTYNSGEFIAFVTYSLQVGKKMLFSFLGKHNAW